MLEMPYSCKSKIEMYFVLINHQNLIQFISRTPLHYAAENEDAEIIKLLMEFGASPFIWSISPHGILSDRCVRKS